MHSRMRSTATRACAKMPGGMSEAERATLRRAAFKQLVALAADPTPAPLAMLGQEDVFVAHLLAGTAPQRIMSALGLSLEEMAGGCIRVLRST